LRDPDKNNVLPDLGEGETMLEYFINPSTFEWEKQVVSRATNKTRGNVMYQHSEMWGRPCRLSPM